MVSSAPGEIAAVKSGPPNLNSGYRAAGTCPYIARVHRAAEAPITGSVGRGQAMTQVPPPP
jgi:hypothetical protein